MLMRSKIFLKLSNSLMSEKMCLELIDLQVKIILLIHIVYKLCKCNLEVVCKECLVWIQWWCKWAVWEECKICKTWTWICKICRICNSIKKSNLKNQVTWCLQTKCLHQWGNFSKDKCLCNKDNNFHLNFSNKAVLNFNNKVECKIECKEEWIFNKCNNLKTLQLFHNLLNIL